VAEGQRPLRPSGDVEAIRIGKVGRVAIGGGQDQQNDLPLPNRLAPERDVFRGAPADELVRGHVARQLLDGAREQRWIGRELADLLGMLEERERPASDEARQVLVAGDEEEHDRGEQLVVAEPVAGFGGVDELGQKVVPRVGARLLDQPVDIA
jgi:hypothetical protein